MYEALNYAGGAGSDAAGTARHPGGPQRAGGEGAAADHFRAHGRDQGAQNADSLPHPRVGAGCRRSRGRGEANATLHQELS